MQSSSHGILETAPVSALFIRAFDINAMTGFYRDVLGLEISYHEAGKFTFFKTGANGPSIALYPGRRGSPGKDDHRIIVFDVKDLETTRAALKGKRVAVGEIEPVPFGRMFQFEDPEGNLIEVHQPTVTAR